MKERQEATLDLLRVLPSDGMEPLKCLFWSELNYGRVDEPISRRGWPPAAVDALAESLTLFAAHDDFHIIYARLHSEGGLHLADERTVVTRLLRDHPYALFIFSDADILMPRRPILDAFEGTVEPVHDRIARNDRESRTLAAIRDTLLPRLASGQMRVKDTESAAEVTR